MVFHEQPSSLRTDVRIGGAQLGIETLKGLDEEFFDPLSGVGAGLCVLTLAGGHEDGIFQPPVEGGPPDASSYGSVGDGRG